MIAPTLPEAAGPATLRLDKWLWYARLLKSRSRAATLIAEGRVRLNGERIAKPAAGVRPGDVLTLPLPRGVVVVRIAALGTRRGPAAEARTLYEEISTPAAPDRVAPRPAGSGRPTKRQRRAIDALGRDPS
ncbi:MAG: RNA-binding S4 domain-containing protein [Pseudomonadota bacterium]